MPQFRIGGFHPHDADSFALETEDHQGPEIGLDHSISFGWAVSNLSKDPSITKLIRSASISACIVSLIRVIYIGGVDPTDPTCELMSEL